MIRPEKIKKISLIVAVGKNGEIGCQGQLPWCLPGDLQYFKRHTMGHPMIVGRKTFESIGRALPGRISIVVSHEAAYREKIDALKDCKSAASLEKALEVVSSLPEGILAHPYEPFIIGGGQIYREALEKELVDEALLTIVERSYPADTVFPLERINDWKETFREKHDGDTPDTPSFTYLRLSPPKQKTGSRRF